MGIGPFTWKTMGSQTAATTGLLRFTVGSSITPSFVTRDHGAINTAWWPAQSAILFANGIDFQYHVIDGTAYLTGPLAPYTAPTIVSTATKATRVWTLAGASAAAARPSDGETIQVGRPGSTGNNFITFKTTLDTTSSADQVKIGADADECIANLKKLVNGTGTQGTEYWAGRTAAYGPTGDSGNWWTEDNKIEVSATTAFAAGSATCTFRALVAGTTGNTYVSSDSTTTGSFPGGTFTGGAVGTGTAPASGAYTGAYANLRTADGAQTAISATADVTQDTNVNLTFSAYDTPPTRDAIDFFRIFRTTVDGSQLFRIGEDASSPFTDSISDDSIDTTFFNEYDDAIYRPYASGYPDRYTCHAVYKGCVFGFGAEKSAQRSMGTVAVVVNTRTVTFSAAAAPKEDWIGRTFAVTGDAVTDYVIVDLVESTRVATLNRLYEGGTNATATYTVTDDRDPCELTYCVPELFNNRPPANSVKGVVTKDPAGGTALVVQAGFLIAFTRTDLWRIQGEAVAGFDFNQSYSGCGAYNQASVVQANGTMYWLGPNGIFRGDGQSEPECLSNPQAQDAGGPRGIQGTIDSITQSAVRGIVGNFNESQQLIRWFVPIDGSPYNNRAIVYMLRTGAFSFDECPYGVTDAQSVETAAGTVVTVVGTAFGRLWQLDLGFVDGGFGYEPVQTISTYTGSTRTVVLSGSPALPTTSSGLAGVAVYHKASDGTIQRGCIASNTASNIVLVTPFATAPAAGDQVCIGDIRLRALSSRSDFGTPESKKMLSSVLVASVPTTGGQLWAAGAINDDSPTMQPLRKSALADFYDMTDERGQHQFFVRRGPGHRVQVELNAFGAGVDMAVTNLTIVVRERSPDTETVQ